MKAVEPQDMVPCPYRTTEQMVADGTLDTIPCPYLTTEQMIAAGMLETIPAGPP
jgi:hypothetical protein